MMTLFSPITNFLTTIFNMIHNLILSVGVPESGFAYVLAITVLTIIIRACLLPFNIKAAKSTQKTQELQPEIKKLQAKYKSDPQKMNAEVMKLYKDNNASMMGGCLPSILPLPILMALYYVFYNMPDIANYSFLWLPSLGERDPYIILPVLSAITTYIPSYLMTKANPAPSSGDGPAMNMGAMNIGMSLMMGFMAYNFKSILVIYWILGGVIQLATTYFVNYKPVMKKLSKITIDEAAIETERSPKFVIPDYEETNAASKKKKRK